MKSQRNGNFRAKFIVAAAAGFMSAGASAATNTTSASSLTNPSAGQSTAPLPGSLSQAAPRKYKFELYNENVIGHEALVDNTASPTSYNYFGMKYTLNDSQSINVRQEFLYNYPHKSRPGKAELADIYVNFNDKLLATLPNDIALAGTFRVYLPVGETSRNVTKRAAAIRAYLIGSKTVGVFNLSGGLVPRFHVQTQETFVDPDEGKTQANNLFDNSTYVEAAYKLNNRVSLWQSAGIDSVFKHNGGPQGASHSFLATTGVSYSPIEQLSLDLALENETAIHNRTHDFALYRSDEIKYYFNVTAGL